MLCKQQSCSCIILIRPNELIMERNISLDYSRLLFATLVIIAHTEGFLNEIPLLGFILKSIATTIAVPVFFIINGYYLDPIIKDNKKFKQYLKHLFIIYVVWSIIYIPFHVDIKEGVNLGFVRHILNLVLGYRHLWYIAALITSVLILKLLQSVSLKKIIIVALIFHFTGYALTRLYLFNISIPTYTLTTNAFFIGLYYVSIGMAIKRYNLTDLVKNKSTHLGIILLLFLLLVGEAIFLFHYGKASNFNISLFVLAPLLFTYISQYGKTEKTSANSLAKLSAGIYFVHFIFIDLFSSMFESLHLFIVVLFFSLLTSVVLFYLNKELKIFL